MIKGDREGRSRLEFGVLLTQGVVSGAPDRVLGEVVEQAIAAEALGFDLALMAEHKGSPEYFGSALPLAFAIAARTRIIRVGTAVAIAPLHHPVELAQDAAMLDQLSAGRLFLGLGAGYLGADFATIGVDIALRGRMLEETIQIVRLAWSGEEFSFSGPFHKLVDAQVLPRPFQQPIPNIYVGAATPAGVRRAATFGDGWITDARLDLPTMAKMAARYRELAGGSGRSARVYAVRYCWPSHNADAARAEFGPPCLSMARLLIEQGRLDDSRPFPVVDSVLLDRFLENRVIFGAPNECAYTIQRLQQEVGIDGLILIFRHPTGPALDRVVDAMTLFSREVVPLVS